jgi:hypothetical protein
VKQGARNSNARRGGPSRSKRQGCSPDRGGSCKPSSPSSDSWYNPELEAKKSRVGKRGGGAIQRATKETHSQDLSCYEWNREGARDRYREIG